MRTRTLGRTGLVVSELALGTLGLAGEAYGSVEASEVDKAVARARDLGVTLFETADSYGAESGGEANCMEARLGRLLERDTEAMVCTKGGNDLDASPPHKRFDGAFIQASAQRSRDRLRRAPAIYLLHHPTVEALRRGEAVAALNELKGKDVFGAWGVACGNPRVATAALDLGASVLEVAYNILHQRDLHDIVGELLESKAGLLVRSPLAYGLLCGTWGPDKSFEPGDHRRERWNREGLVERLRHVAALRPLVHDDAHTLRSVALRFVLANQLVGSMVVGARTAAQVEANVRAIGSGPPYLTEWALARVPDLLPQGT